VCLNLGQHSIIRLPTDIVICNTLHQNSRDDGCWQRRIHSSLDDHTNANLLTQLETQHSWHNQVTF